MTKFQFFGSMEITQLQTKLSCVRKRKKEQLGAGKQRKYHWLENRKKGSHIVNDSILLRLNFLLFVMRFGVTLESLFSLLFKTGFQNCKEILHHKVI